MFDRPGLGHTQPLKAFGTTITDQAELLASAAVALGAERPIVAGQSFGGAIAMAWAVARPSNIAAAVSISGATYPWEGEIDALTGALANPVIGPVLSRLASAWVSTDYVSKSIEGTFTPQDPVAGYANDELRMLSPNYSALTIPVEIVHGDSDAIVPLHVHSARLVDDIEGANLVALEGLGHMPQHLAHDAVIAAIDRAATRAGLR